MSSVLLQNVSVKVALEISYVTTKTVPYVRVVVVSTLESTAEALAAFGAEMVPPALLAVTCAHRYIFAVI